MSLISCDEAGFTGSDLLNEDQPYFVYASVELSRDEAASIVSEIRSTYQIQSSELKAKILRKRANWKTIALNVAQRLTGRARIAAFHKKLNLAGKTFEYLFEPVLQEDNGLFYSNNFQRFFMNAFYSAMVESEEEASNIASDLQAFMRSFDPKAAASLFEGQKKVVSSQVVGCLVRFCKGYSKTIERCTNHLHNDQGLFGRLALDLTNTAAFSLVFGFWGLKFQQIELLCDESKPLRLMVDFLNGFVGRDDVLPLTDGTKTFQIRGNLSKPVLLGCSESNPTLQIADLLAGITVDVLKSGQIEPKGMLERWISGHLDKNSILPEPTWANTSELQPRVNLYILHELARRADLGADPLKGMRDVYERAYIRFKPPASRITDQQGPKRKNSSAM